MCKETVKENKENCAKTLEMLGFMLDHFITQEINAGEHSGDCTGDAHTCMKCWFHDCIHTTKSAIVYIKALSTAMCDMPEHKQETYYHGDATLGFEWNQAVDACTLIYAMKEKECRDLWDVLKTIHEYDIKDIQVAGSKGLVHPHEAREEARKILYGRVDKLMDAMGQIKKACEDYAGGQFDVQNIMCIAEKALNQEV